jgi:Mrp family chromosome partitioning ATPase
LLGAGSFFSGPADRLTVELRARLSQLRRDFDYALIHAPAAGSFSEATILGQLTDGVVVVLGAHTTRRLTARKTKERLLAANVRVIGSVLADRSFPIPDVLYHRL